MSVHEYRPEPQKPFSESGSSPPRKHNPGQPNFVTWSTPQHVETKHGSVDCVGFKHAGGKCFLIALDGRRIPSDGARIIRGGAA